MINVFAQADLTGVHLAGALHIDLLAIENQYKLDDYEQHFLAITDFGRLVSGNNGTNASHHYCKRCFLAIRINSEEEKNPNKCKEFVEHLRLCQELKLQRLELPNEGKDTMQFKSFIKQETVPFVIIADFETTVERNENIVNIDKRTGFVRDDKEGREKFYDGMSARYD